MKHGGCYFCQGGKGEVLISGVVRREGAALPDSVAVCATCRSKVETIKRGGAV